MERKLGSEVAAALLTPDWHRCTGVNTEHDPKYLIECGKATVMAIMMVGRPEERCG